MDESFKLFLMRKLEDLVVEAEETIEDLRGHAEAMAEYQKRGGRDIEAGT